MALQEGVDAILQRDCGWREPHDPSHGDPLLRAAANLGSSSIHAGRNSQAQPSSMSCCRSKSAICCDSTRGRWSAARA